MKRILLFALIAQLPFACSAPLRTQGASAVSQQAELPTPYSIYKKGLAEGNYLAPLLELRARESQYLASEGMRESYLEMITLLHSYVGNFDMAYSYEEKLLSSFEPMNKMRERNAKELSNSPLDNYQPRDALEAIKSVADKHQVVMINEEHRTPLHRAFTLRLLPALYARGFRYFAAETLNEEDADLNRRGYPVQRTGFYTADPVYGDLVRAALKLGFKVVPYEHIPKGCRPKPDNPESCNDERERGQAQNLYDRILRNDPKAKILVHVGRSHNAKLRTDEQFAFMAWYFREITKIDPFSVDQVRFSERRNPADEHPLYRYVTRKWKLTEPTAFESGEGSLWSDATFHNLRIFHPRAQYERGRPTWLRLGGVREPFGLYDQTSNGRVRKFLPAGRGTYLVQAFVAGESADAVPVDQVVVSDPASAPALMLPKGRFRIRAIDEAGKIVGGQEVAIR